VRPLYAALAACVLFGAPVALLAQNAPQPPNVRPIPPVKRPAPKYTGGYRSNQHGTTGYPIVIDGSVMNRFLATPTPAPKRTPAARPQNNGQDVFETHSTDDAK
jgi:hypothetical protein